MIAILIIIFTIMVAALAVGFLFSVNENRRQTREIEKQKRELLDQRVTNARLRRLLESIAEAKNDDV